jgi:hypothetical protein
MNTSVWQINNNLSCHDNDKINAILNGLSLCQENNMTFLLNKTKNNIVELLINDIVNFHLKRLNIANDIFVEFWFKTYKPGNNELHIDKDEYDKKINKSSNYNVPFLSCITYLNDNNTNPTVITDIDKDKYKYKNFESGLYICLPRKMKQIVFDGGKYFHGEGKLLENENTIRNILVINLWNVKPLNVPLFQFDYFVFKYGMYHEKEIDLINTTNILFNITELTNQITIKTNLLNDNFFNNLLYTLEPVIFMLKDVVDKYNNYDLIIFKNNNIDEQLNQEDVDNEKTNIDLSLDKFKQRFIIKNHFTKDMCEWIINESENYASNNNGWTKKRHDNYPTTDLPAELIPSIFSFLLFSFKNTIQKEIMKNYEIPENYTFQIKDLFVVKYDMENQTSLDMHCDASSITANILLSNINDFSGGGTYFEDDLTVLLNQGDMLIHSSKTKHAGIEITKGKRYVLLFFINILV